MSQSEDDEVDSEPYEVIETPGTRNLVEQLITMDLAGRPVVQQISIGGVSGWFAGYVFKRVGKLTLSAIGGGILLIQVAHRAGYININWKRMEKDVDKITTKVKKEVKKIKKNEEEIERGIVALANRGYRYVKRNTAAATGFAGGFLLGLTL
ncbi:FUN14 domain-containing protein 1-like [Stylophora pistillata]|uniref:FUN14 domain-containing protein 1B n=1 Tax=Stylophora pistillata TaxID=50429 RepID=A0A2B4SBS6_STYPI|nr:FUN14 domain-containing protein 1-like [Stylophora pistillata]PFX26816.1 FUN14 domain-containing protein 1B [Stylophora pistillata]